jgi:hypothetical protein
VQHVAHSPKEPPNAANFLSRDERESDHFGGKFGEIRPKESNVDARVSEERNDGELRVNVKAHSDCARRREAPFY